MVFCKWVRFHTQNSWRTGEQMLAQQHGSTKKYTSMKKYIQRFWRNTSGNFGIISAFVAVPLLGAAGLAIDVADALEVRMELYNAADAAAVGSVAEKSAALAASLGMGADGDIEVAKQEALALFRSQLPEKLKDMNVQVSVNVKRLNKTFTSEVNFSATVPTTFMAVLGRTSIDVSGTAHAEYQTGSFIDFYMLLDNTPSMGVGATDADVNMLQNHTGDSCAFACHTTAENITNNNYTLARSLGVTLRIDVVRQATQALTQKAKDTRVFSNQFKMAVYTFGAKAEVAKLTTVSELSADMDKVRSYAENIDLMTIPYQGYNNDQQTSFDDALTQMNTIVPKAGTGVSDTDRSKVVFFVSDGVGDSAKPKCTKATTNGTRCQEPIDISYCKTLKDRGVTIASLYTTYRPLPKNSWYNSWIKPFQGEIATRMEACASPGMYFEVSPTEGIDKAMQALFMKVISKPRLAS